MHAQLKNCHIAVDFDPHLSQVASTAPGGARTGRKGSGPQPVGGAGTTPQGRGVGSVVAWLVGAVLVGLAVFGLYTASHHLSERAKKIK